MPRQLDRRLFLRGLGGACVAAPFLGSLAGRDVQAQSSPSGRRLIAMFTYYGCITTRWFPQKSHGALTAEDLEGTTLAPLVPYVNKLLMPRGIRAMNEWTTDMSLGQGNDPHINVTGSYFTCQPLTPNSDDPFDLVTNAHFTDRPIGPSLDHVMAQQLSSTGIPLFMRVGNTNPTRAAISFSAAEEAFPGLGTPTQILTGLTGLFGEGTPLSPDSYQALRGKSVLDLVKGDLETLESFDMSGADRHKLEAWKALLDETSLACGADLVADLGLNDEVIAAVSTASSMDRLSTVIAGTSLDGADVYSNLAVLAAACNANPVIFLAYPANFVYSGLGLTHESASLANRVGSANLGGTCVPDVLNQIATVDAFYARKFAHLVAKLDETSDGEGSLLDTTAAVWFQEVSDGAARNLNNLPILQAGSCGGYFKTGWAINVDGGADDLTRGNSEAVCSDGSASEFNVNDATMKVTGTDRSIANAPINKYFCNLMNALGVKAGEDGFALASGTEEVRCFGRYDKTEDFIGGDVNPPMIHDPGEFEELRA
jgi:hypothetical protein